jgi:predicted methyltransferase
LRNDRNRLTAAALIISIVLAGCSEKPVDSSLEKRTATTSKLQHELESSTRPDADRRRDASRKPSEVLAFLGIEKGMHAIDIIAAGGYYTEVLAVAVGPEGHVVAFNPPVVMTMNNGIYGRQLNDRLGAGRLSNVARLDKDLADIRATDGPFDFAIMALNFHDIYNNSGPRGAENILRIAYTLLRPGGVLGIIDHSGDPGVDNAPLHRIDKAVIYESAVVAGLVVEDESNLLRQADDDHLLSVFDPQVQGNTDRFLLRLRKPEQ